MDLDFNKLGNLQQVANVAKSKQREGFNGVYNVMYKILDSITSLRYITGIYIMRDLILDNVPCSYVPVT